MTARLSIVNGDSLPFLEPINKMVPNHNNVAFRTDSTDKPALIRNTRQ